MYAPPPAAASAKNPYYPHPHHQHHQQQQQQRQVTSQQPSQYHRPPTGGYPQQQQPQLYLEHQQQFLRQQPQPPTSGLPGYHHQQQPPPLYSLTRQSSSGAGSGFGHPAHSGPQRRSFGHIGGGVTGSKVGGGDALQALSGSTCASILTPDGNGGSSSHQRLFSRGGSHRRSGYGFWLFCFAAILFVTFKTWLAVSVPVERSVSFWEQARFIASHPTGGRFPSVDALLAPFHTRRSSTTTTTSNNNDDVAASPALRTGPTDPRSTAPAPWLPIVASGAFPLWAAQMARLPDPLVAARAVVALMGSFSIALLATSLTGWLDSTFAGLACLAMATAAPGTSAEALGSVAVPSVALAALLAGRGSLCFGLAVLEGLLVLPTSGPLHTLWVVPLLFAALPNAGVFSTLLLSLGAGAAALGTEAFYRGRVPLLQQLLLYRHKQHLQISADALVSSLRNLMPSLPSTISPHLWHRMLSSVEASVGAGTFVLGCVGACGALASVLRLTSPRLSAVGSRVSVRGVQFWVMLWALPAAVVVLLLETVHFESVSLSSDEREPPVLLRCLPFLLVAAVAGTTSMRGNGERARRRGGRSENNGLLGELDDKGTKRGGQRQGYLRSSIVMAAAICAVLWPIVRAPSWVKMGADEREFFAAAAAVVGAANGGRLCFSQAGGSYLGSFVRSNENLVVNFVVPTTLGLWTTAASNEPFHPVQRRELDDCDILIGSATAGDHDASIRRPAITPSNVGPLNHVGRDVLTPAGRRVIAVKCLSLDGKRRSYSYYGVFSSFFNDSVGDGKGNVLTTCVWSIGR